MQRLPDVTKSWLDEAGTSMNRGVIKEQLTADVEALAQCCKPTNTVWPSTELLQSIESGVLALVGPARKNGSSRSWKKFERLNRRMTKLRLVLRVDNLVQHAHSRLKEAGESALNKLQRYCNSDDAKKLLADIERLSADLRNAKTIDWLQHEGALKIGSSNRKLELACGDSPASPRVICYARALELLADDYAHLPLRNQSRPLLQWLARIEHPNAKELLTFDYAMVSELERRQKALLTEKSSRVRQQQRERTRKHREWHHGREVYLKYWMKLCANEKYAWWRRAYRQAASKSCELCGNSFKEPYLWFHITRHIGRCPRCQEAEWWSDGYEITRHGLPWSYLRLTREERWAEREHRLGSRVREWLQTDEGQRWLREFRATDA
jgi:hypothetical protein